MVKERMDLLELLRKGGMDGDVDFLREALRVLVEGIMDAEVSSRIGAEYGERCPERATQRSRVPGSGVRGRGSGERETTASSLAGKEESSRKEDNGGQGKDGPAGAIAQGGNGR